MKISDLLGRSAVDQGLARAVDSLRLKTAYMAGSTAVHFQVQSQQWLEKSLAEVMEPRIAVNHLTSPVDELLSSRIRIDSLAEAALAPTYNLSSITALSEAANAIRDLGVNKGIQDVLASFKLPLDEIETVQDALRNLAADSIFPDFEALAGITDSVLKRYAGLNGIFDVYFSEDLWAAAEEDVAAVRSELAREKPLAETGLLEFVVAMIQRAQALADRSTPQSAPLIFILTFIVGNALSGVAGAEWTRWRLQDERLQSAENEQAELQHEEAQARTLRGFAEQLQAITDATKLRAVITRSAHLRAAPDSSSSSYGQLSPGDTVLIRGQKNGWLQVTANVLEDEPVAGWVYAKRAKAVLE